MTAEPIEGTRRLLPVASGRRSAAALWQLARRQPRLLFLAALTTAGSSVAAVASPLLLGRIVDAVVAGGPRAHATLLGLTAGLVVAALAAGVLLGFAQRFSRQLGVTIAAELREDVLERSLQLDPQTLEAAGSGDVTARVTEDVQLINTSVELAASVLVSLVTVVVTAFGLLTLDWRLALAFLAVFPVHWAGIRFILPLLGPRFAAERRAATARSQALLTVLDGAATVRAYGMADRQVGVVERASLAANEAGLKALRGTLGFANLMNAAEAVGLVSILTTGFLLVRGGDASVGDVTAAALLFHRLFGPLGYLLLSFSDMQKAGSALARLVGVADLPAPVLAPVPYAPPLDVAVHGVSHHYPDGPPVLHGLDVTIPAGRSLAVVGESGAGKTTLAALIGAVFPATGGSIRLGPDPVDTLDPVDVRRRVGVVTQEVHTFVGTLAEDLRLARPDATDAELVAALAVVGADDWVAALPAGLATTVGVGGHTLTADQAQQLALARVILVDPPIVILDEATAEAGSAGARALERSAQAVVAGRTAVVVAHRLTQARACDRIAVMHAGRIVELGSHDELVAAGGAYARLWAAWSS